MEPGTYSFWRAWSKIYLHVRFKYKHALCPPSCDNIMSSSFFLSSSFFFSLFFTTSAFLLINYFITPHKTAQQDPLFSFIACITSPPRVIIRFLALPLLLFSTCQTIRNNVWFVPTLANSSAKVARTLTNARECARKATGRSTGSCVRRSKALSRGLRQTHAVPFSCRIVAIVPNSAGYMSKSVQIGRLSKSSIH